MVENEDLLKELKIISKLLRKLIKSIDALRGL